MKKSIWLQKKSMNSWRDLSKVDVLNLREGGKITPCSGLKEARPNICLRESGVMFALSKIIFQVCKCSLALIIQTEMVLSRLIW